MGINMKNYQKLHYDKYYIQQGDDYVSCTKAECFNSGEPPTSIKPFKQRWYYAEDGSMAVRLERSSNNADVFNANASSIKRMERTRDKEKGMLSYNSSHVSEDGMPCDFEIPCTTNVEDIVMRIEELRLLTAALKKLSDEYRELYEMIIAGIRKKDIAKYFNISVDGVYYREKQLYKFLASDEGLKNWFNKD